LNLKAPRELPSVVERARRYLAKCSPAISHQYGHNATFRVACVLVHGFALPGQVALDLLREWNQTCQPVWSETELVHKINSALATPPKNPLGHLLVGDVNAQPGYKTAVATVLARPTQPIAMPRKVQFEPETLKRVAADAGAIDTDFIKARSPLCPETQTPVTFLLRMFRTGERVLVFDKYESQGRHVCECIAPPCDAGSLDHLVNGCKDGVWFLCNPVDGEWHPNPRLGGKRSRRSEESVTAWRYLLLESDEADPAEWMGILVQLPLRIASICTSGGRSLHALVRVDATTKADWNTKAQLLKPLMTVLGADPASMTGVRLTRLPGCYREQEGPPPPKDAPVRKRWVDEPLRFDNNGDPIWTPSSLWCEPPRNLWTGGNLQELLYLNPAPDTTPIQARPTLHQIYQEWLAQKRREQAEANH